LTCPDCGRELARLSCVVDFARGGPKGCLECFNKRIKAGREAAARLRPPADAMRRLSRSARELLAVVGKGGADPDPRRQWHDEDPDA